MLAFCKECSNMLYPTEKRAEKKLYYACRNCDASEPATDPRVYDNELKQKITSVLKINREITLDPTLPRTKDVVCEKCGGREAVFFTPSDENMELLFVCCNGECNYYWTGQGITDAARKAQAQRMATAAGTPQASASASGSTAGSATAVSAPMPRFTSSHSTAAASASTASGAATHVPANTAAASQSTAMSDDPTAAGSGGVASASQQFQSQSSMSVEAGLPFAK